MRLDGDGNIGIGTTTPSNKLDVRGVINASSDIYFNNGTKVGLGNLSGGGTAGYLAQWSGASGLNNSPIYTSGGNVGIGTESPSKTLDILGELLISSSNSNSTNKLGRIFTKHYDTSEEDFMGIDIR